MFMAQNSRGGNWLIEEKLWKRINTPSYVATLEAPGDRISHMEIWCLVRQWQWWVCSIAHTTCCDGALAAGDVECRVRGTAGSISTVEIEIEL